MTDRMSRRRLWPMLGLSVLLTAPALAAPPVRVTAPWFRYLLSSIPAGGYMTLRNPGAAAVVLTGADSPACGSLMLHRTDSGGGTDRTAAGARVTIPARGGFRFAPGGYHLMCMKPRMHPGQTVPVRLHFAGGGRLAVRFAVHGASFGPSPSPPMPMQMQMK